MMTLGVDLTGAPRAVMVDESGEVAAREQGSRHEELMKRATGSTRVTAIGVAIAEDADAKVGIAGATRCSPGSAAVAAEAWIGEARGAQHAVCLSIGQHVYAGLWLDGRIWSGAHNRAGAAAWPWVPLWR